MSVANSTKTSRLSLRRNARSLRIASIGLALWLAFVAAATVAAAELRTFTDTSGRTMMAKIMAATETTVRVRRDDDRVFELTLENLSAADRAHVTAWRTKQAFAFGGIEVSAHRVRLDSALTQTRSSTRKTEDWCYTFSIANESRADLSGLTVEYRMFFIRDLRARIDDSAKADRDELPLQRKIGRATIGLLPAGAATELRTAVVTLTSVRLKPGRRSPSASKRRVEDTLAGLWVRVMQQGETLHEFASPATLMKSEAW